MTTNITAVQTQIVEDAADTEDNNINTIKPIVLYMYYRLLSYITRILFRVIGQKVLLLMPMELVKY